MFEILRSPLMTPSSKMFKEDVGTAIEPDDEGLDEFSRWDTGFPLAHLAAGRLEVPCPAKLGKAPHPTSKC